ncbi:PLC-like phosphodiesterase [Podospora appendiculata]|uniref:glycerophosphodiester phosphodiesterase n=1 Tax=Podospora appendiculata TaxID=314037 RepID=A0AAE0X6U9_9PEZI|nr:PLC-like phosphodiesterase [Podospora appendiculata]
MASALLWLALAVPAFAAPTSSNTGTGQNAISRISLGPRPYWLVDHLEDGPLKSKLASCSEKHMRRTDFSIGHRGGGILEFPEETRESIMAGTRMGAGIQECDVTFTKDKQLICRHDQCDLHTTTNVVTIPELNAKCTTPFKPAANGAKASAKCCTSDFTLAEIKTLCSKMDGSNTAALTPADYIKGTPVFRTDLYSTTTCSAVLTLKEYIKLVDGLGLKFTPELKTPVVPMPFPAGSDYTQAKYAQQMIDEFKTAGIKPDRVFIQSFLYDDLLYWLKAEPKFAKQAIFLDESADTTPLSASVANLTQYAAAGVKIMGPPLPYLVTVKDGKIVPSEYAIEAKRLGLKIITWSLDRSGFLGDGSHGGYYYGSIANVTNHESDVYKLLHVLAQDVGVQGVFSDWSATVTYYANCFGLF